MTCRGLEVAECRDESGPSVLELLSLRRSRSSSSFEIPSRYRASRTAAAGLTESDEVLPDSLDAENGKIRSGDAHQ